MRRFLLRLYIFVLLATYSAIALVDFGIPRVFHRQYSQMQRESVQGYAELLSHRLLSHPHSEWQNIIDGLNRRSGNSIHLVSIPPAGITDAQDLADLGLGLPVFTADGESFYLRLGSTDLAAHVHRTKLNTQSVLYTAYAALAALILAASLLWVRHHWSELDSLSSVAEEFGNGDFSIRSELPNTSYISGLAHRFNQMAERIQLYFASQQHLVNAVSHELRTPIARVAFELELLKSSTTSPSVHARVDAIAGDILELESLVDEILELQRLEHLRPRSVRTTFDMKAIVAAAVEQAAAGIHGTSGIAVTAVFEGNVDIEGEQHAINRALANLLQNAIRYAASAVIVAVHGTDGEVIISVDDDGPGVPSPQWELVFQPFQRLDRSRDRRTGGHGLGLSIVMQVAKAHAGSALCERSTVLGGARFVISVPRAIADEARSSVEI